MKKKLVSVFVMAAMTLTLLAGCTGGTAGADSSSTTGADTAAETGTGAGTLDYSNIKIGEITSLVVNDGGWCQATHESLLNAMTELGIPEENLLTIENVTEDQVSVENAYNALASEGVNLIFGASAGYATFLSDLAAENPDIIVAQQGDQVANLIGYQIRNYEGMFLAGYACAMLSESDTLGFAASVSEASVRAAINGFALGAKFANPDAKVQLVWANSWYDVDIETQSALTLINQGITYMGMEASSPAIPQTCEANGAYCIGYNVDMKDLAPEAVLFSYVWNFAPIFSDIITSVAEGTASADTYYYEGGECAGITDFNDDLIPEDIQEAILQVKNGLASGDISVFGGYKYDLMDNEGNILVPAGESMSDDKINTQEFLVDNVIGSWN